MFYYQLQRKYLTLFCYFDCYITYCFVYTRTHRYEHDKITDSDSNSLNNYYGSYEISSNAFADDDFKFPVTSSCSLTVIEALIE